MKKRKFSFLEKLILILASLLLVAVTISAFAWFFDPRTFILPAFLGLAYPFLMLANLLFLIYWILRKRTQIAITTLLVLACGFPTFNATFKWFGTEEIGPKKDENIRIMTYNVHNFKEFGENNTVAIKRKMLSIIKSENPDIICFQEFYTRFKGEFDIADSLKTYLNAPYYYFVPASKNNYEAIGLAIFSKYPIVDKKYISFKNGGNGCIYVDLQINNKPLRIYNLHLRSISFEKQDYTYLDKVTKDINPNKQSTKRIYRMLREAFKKRSDDVKLIENELQKCDSAYILAGDFNDTPASFAVNKLTKNLNNAFVKKGQGLGRTYNGKFPNFQIDYIASSKDIEIVNYHITEAKLSDHYPVRVDLKFME